MYKHPTFLPFEETEDTLMYEFPNGTAVYVVAKQLPNIFDVQLMDIRDPKKVIFLGNSMEARNQFTVDTILTATANMKESEF